MAIIQYTTDVLTPCELIDFWNNGWRGGPVDEKLSEVYRTSMLELEGEGVQVAERHV